MKRLSVLCPETCLAMAGSMLLLALLPAETAMGEAGAKPGRVYAMVPGLSREQTLMGTRSGSAGLPDLQLCAGDRDSGDRDSGDRGVAVDRVLCALPHSRDRSSPSASTPSQSPQTPGFAYRPPGELDAQNPNQGRVGDRLVYAPNIVFPLRLAPDQQAHLNSQIWGHGGNGWAGKGEAGGSECDPINYDAMQQRDTYCEVRNWSMPMCPGGSGNPGQDIRPPTCKDNAWEAVAVVDGIITAVTANTTVRLHGSDGTDYFYLHMHPQSIAVTAGQSVKQGDVLGRVSKYFGGDPNGTAVHLHFQIRQTIRVDGQVLSVYVPSYTSLIAAYRKAKGLDAGIGPDGNLVVDARLETGAAASGTTQQPSTSTPPTTSTTTSVTPATSTPTTSTPTTSTPTTSTPTTSTPTSTTPSSSTPTSSTPTSTTPTSTTPTSTTSTTATTSTTPSATQTPSQTSPAQTMPTVTPQTSTPVTQTPVTNMPDAQQPASTQTIGPSPVEPKPSRPQTWWQKAVDGAKGWLSKPTK